MRARRTSGGGRGDERGAVLVELALAILPISVLAFGTIDFGRAYAVETQLRNAARAAANYARSFPTQVSATPDASGAGTCADPNNIQYQAVAEPQPASSSTLPAGSVLSVVDVTTGATLTGCGPDAGSPPVVAPGDTLQVQVSAPFTLISPLIGSLLHNVTVHGTVQVVAQ